MSIMSSIDLDNRAMHGNQYWYCGVAFSGIERIYSYISDSGRIEIDSKVVVPFGSENQLRIGTVKTCALYSDEYAPYPVDRTKHIKRLATAVDMLDLASNAGKDAGVLAAKQEEMSSEEQLAYKIGRWKRDLLDTGKRNKMINFKETKRTTLRILEPEASELFYKLASSDKALSFQQPIDRTTDYRTYSMIALMETLSYNLSVQKGDIKTGGSAAERDKTLKNLRSKAKLAQEEQGINILYLCFGFIYWREHDRPNSACYKAPLLLMPVTLSIKSLKSPYMLSRFEDEIEVNPTLSYLFRTEFGIELPEFEFKNKSSYAEYIAKVEEIVDKRGWKVDSKEVSLGLLSFLKISMYHDLESNLERIRSHPVLRAISGDRAALRAIPATAENYDFDGASPTDWHEVVDADSSQEEAILLSKLGVSFVMQGPPGTGKSQTITNIIAEALADGKKVLFVSEKAAALQVVLRRLKDVRLDDFCLSLHDYKANKKEIIDSIGANLSLSEADIRPRQRGELTQLSNIRTQLAQYKKDLHQTVMPLGVSVYSAFGNLTKLSDATTVSFELENPRAVSQDQYASFLYQLDALERSLNALGGGFETNPWHGTTVKSAGIVFKNRMLQETEKLSEKIRALAAAVSSFNETFSCRLGNTWGSLEVSIEELNSALELPLFPFWWTDIAKQETLLGSVRKAYDQKQALALTLQKCREVFSDSVLDAPAAEWLSRAKQIIHSFSDIGYDAGSAGTGYLSDALRGRGEMDAVLAQLTEASEQYRAVAELFDLDSKDSFQNILRAREILSLYQSAPKHLLPVWFTSSAQKESLSLAEKVQLHAELLKSAMEQLRRNWSEQVLSIPISDLQNAFFGDFAWVYQNGSAPVQSVLTAQEEQLTELLDAAEVLMKAYARAVKVFGFSREDTFDSICEVSELLAIAADAPYMESQWFHLRANLDARPFLAEAIEHAEKIRALKTDVLENWEPEVLAMEDEAIAMLGRFKTEHVGLFHRSKAGYKSDMKTLRALAKEVGASIAESDAVSLLQAIKDIHDETQWFADRKAELTELAGRFFRGADTDWDAVLAGMNLAAEIADLFPFANIPEEVITALQKAADSIQTSAQIKELSSVLTIERAENYKMLLSKMSWLEENLLNAPLSTALVPRIRDFLQVAQSHALLISQLQNARLSCEPLTLPAIQELIRIAENVQNEHAWFAAQEKQLQAYIGAANNAIETDWDEVKAGIQYAGSVITVFAGQVPEQFVSLLCCDGERLYPAADHLNADHLKKLSDDIWFAAAKKVDESKSISERLIPNLTTWKNAAEALGELYHEMLPFVSDSSLKAETLIAGLPIVIRAQTDREQFLLKTGGLAEKLGPRYQGLDTDWQAIEADIQKVSNFQMAYNASIKQDFLEAICNDEPFRREVLEKLEEIKGLKDTASGACLAFAGYFDNSRNLLNCRFSDLAESYDRCAGEFDRLNDWMDFAEARDACKASGLSSFVDEIIRLNNTVPDVRRAFEKGFYSQWLLSILDEAPAVQAFRVNTHEGQLQKFKTLDEEQQKIATQRIRYQLIKDFPSLENDARRGSELFTLRHEMEKKKRIMPLRRLFREIPSLLLTLKPCLMMSPLSVAYFLDADQYQFDMVIFDEASQVFPQDAVGAIFRSKQVIIAGDSKQLPPTNFFSASTSNASDEYDNDEEGYYEEAYDSILEETAHSLPNRTLLWHYRSAHEQLIAFSNREIYKNHLITFPSSNECDPDTGVEFVFVEDGYYEPSPKNYNEAEAKRIVSLVKKHIEEHPNRSLGVIAFSEKQQNKIALEIQKFREQNSEYEFFFEEGRENEFFVKNLENVQGDERDTIIFSVGYARTKAQKENGRPMSMRFGPLGLSGGERRLNVAITRARINVKLVSSIVPSDIDLARTESEGVRMLRAYIEYAMHGASLPVSQQQDMESDDFADTIAEFLREKGFRVRQNVGCSGYRIDIAVQHPSETIEQNVAAVECDGYSYASAKTVRDRDRLRGSVLERMGWNLYRVWSSEWYKNPEAEGRKLVDFLHRAISESEEKIRVLEERKRLEEEAHRKKLEAERAKLEAQEAKARRERERLEAERAAERQEAEWRRREAEERRAERSDRIRRASTQQRKSAPAKSGPFNPVRKKTDLSWVKAGALVRHERFGNGTVVAVEKDRISVRFGGETRTLTYPATFENGTLAKREAQKQGQANARPTHKAGDRVMSSAFGEGVISSIADGKVIVAFQNVEKTFMYPDAFDKGFLKLKT